MVLAVGVGSVRVSPADVVGTVAAGVTGQQLAGNQVIIWNMRLPRVLTAALVGGALALAGAVYQGVFRNPLADPYLLGTASGAGFGATLVAAVGASVPLLAWLGGPLTAFVFALGTVLLVAVLARAGSSLPTVRLILAGVVVGSILTAGTSFLMVASREQAASMMARLLGGFGFSGWGDVTTMALVALPALALVGAFARALDLFQLGEDAAAQLGLPVDTVKYLLLGVATLVTAAAVSVAGIIGFVGLIVPHAVRLSVGPAHARLLPLAMLWGAGFMVLADVLARTLLSPVEVPVGIVTAVVGGPFFLLLLRGGPGSVQP